MITEEQGLWPGILRPLHALISMRWFRLAVAGWHFHVDAVSLVHDHIWDGTSFVLRKGIRRYAHDGQRILDLGTGHLGLLAVYCSRTHRVRAVAVDINADFVENARLVARASEVMDIEFRCSDWFSNVDGTFDLIFGNVPYIPSEVGYSENKEHIHPEIWNGGCDGLCHERTILHNVGRYLKPDGLLLLGIDTGYIPRIATVSLVNGEQDIELREVIRSWVSACEIYVIGLRHPDHPVC